MKTPTGLTFRVLHECGNETKIQDVKLNPLEQNIREMSKLQESFSLREKDSPKGRMRAKCVKVSAFEPSPAASRLPLQEGEGTREKSVSVFVSLVPGTAHRSGIIAGDDALPPS